MINLDCAELDLSVDAELVPMINIANICCGAYAGNKEMIEHAVSLCKLHKVLISAHIGYPDRENFGRVQLNLSKSELSKSIIDQINLLDTICSRDREKIRYVKFHGALYHDVNNIEETANSLIQIVKEKLPDIEGIITMGGSVLSGNSFLGVHIMKEGFADRRYESDSSLKPRKYIKALYKSRDQIIKQYRELKLGKISTEVGIFPLEVETICFHGDNPESAEALKYITSGNLRAKKI